jgi:hypothetical protein
MEVTWEEARAHLGMATQRQWNDQAIARTTPALVSLYAIITLTAHLLIATGATCVRSTAWYGKTRPTFSDAIAWVRRQLWEHIHFSMSQPDIEQVLREKKPFILRCMLDGIKKLQGRMVKWHRCALSVSITWA